MRKNNGVLNVPRTKFHINETRLDSIALEIVWERDKELWREEVVRKYPVFGSMQIWNFEEARKILEQIYVDRQNELLQAQQRFASWWSGIEIDWYPFLTDIFDLKNEEDIYYNAHIGIAPIFPRDIEEGSFLVPLYADRQDILRISAHETSHFVFYPKLKEVNFTDSPSEKHIWIISEILVPLLFGDKRAIAILGQMPQSSYMCKQSLIEKYREIYLERAEGKTSAEEFIKCLFEVKIKNEELDPKYFD